MQINKLNRTLGVIGGGQLGKMIGLAAANLGISCHFLIQIKMHLLKIFLNHFIIIIMIMKKNY